MSLGAPAQSFAAPMRIALPGPFTLHVDADPGVSSNLPDGPVFLQLRATRAGGERPFLDVTPPVVVRK